MSKNCVLLFLLLIIHQQLVGALTWEDYAREIKETSERNIASKISEPFIPLLRQETSKNEGSHEPLLRSDSMYRLLEFYSSLSSPEVKRCPDSSHLMPDCTDCIPGMLRLPGNSTCSILDPTSVAIRNEIVKLTRGRFGEHMHPLKPFALYPYLESPDYLARQVMTFLSTARSYV
jgi:hypothetical protein